MTSAFRVQRGVAALRGGGIIAYPTEGVWGLGCDPNNMDAVMALLALKQRPVKKGLILVAADIVQLEPYLCHLNQQQLAVLKKSWPGANTWLVPANYRVPEIISGGQPDVALRVSAHPTVIELCKKFGGAIVSTSANRSGKRPAKTLLEIQLQFSAYYTKRCPGRVTVVPGALGGNDKPSTIRNLVTGAVIRN